MAVIQGNTTVSHRKTHKEAHIPWKWYSQLCIDSRTCAKMNLRLFYSLAFETFIQNNALCYRDNFLLVVFYSFVFLRQDLPMQPRLALASLPLQSPWCWVHRSPLPHCSKRNSFRGKLQSYSSLLGPFHSSGPAALIFIFFSSGISKVQVPRSS